MTTIQSTFAPGPAHPAFAGPDGSTRTPSSFGAASTTLGPGFRANELMNGPRFRELEFRERFFRSTHHDNKFFDFNGRLIRPGAPSTQPLIGASLPTFYVPLDQRRPSDPYRLAKLIVDSFTGLVFGEGMWPAIQVVGDPDTQDFADALARAQRLQVAMVKARNVGGSTGTVGLSWRFYDGLPRVAVHRPQFLHVHEWADREELIPAHVSQIYQVERRVWDPRRRAEATMLFWFRRDWTTEADVAFHEVPVSEKNPHWLIDEENTHAHGDGFCHFVWIQNLPDEDETSVDGRPDYDALYENMNSLDTVSSVTARGAVLNLDPTLKLKMDPEIVKRYGVKKGSDNAIVTGKDGDADYMELAGTSIAVGNELVGRQRAHSLEVSQCVVPDPNTIAAAGTSSLAIRLVYRPMLSKANVLRGQYGQGICRLLEQQIESARRHLAPAPASQPYEVQEGAFLDLPPRVVTEDLLDEVTREPTGEVAIMFEEQTPGAGGAVDLAWPNYFPPTPAEVQQGLTTLSVAAGGKPVLSHKTSARLAAAMVGVDFAAEWRQILQERAAAKRDEAGMFPPAGGPVGSAGELPEGAEGDAGEPDEGERAGDGAPASG